ncbi:MAG: peptidoglycan editing factor PgeF [Bacteroidetes bacterium]|nr:peptidoglycan editing factor PgeF [Fibrella sp.]
MPDTSPASVRSLYRVPALLATFSELTAAESTRHGGISPPPYQSLNLGFNTDDVPEHTEENRRLFFSALGIDPERVVSSHQCHGTELMTATQPGRFDGYDALITAVPGLVVAVSIADCVPILVYDTGERAVAAIHAGWRGTVGGIVSKTLRAMQQQFGTRPGDCFAYVGTCIDKTSFEVGPDVAGAFDAPFVAAGNQPGTFLVNLQAANARQLTDFGIPSDQIGFSPYSTVLNNDDYFSHRAERGQTGRMLAVIGLNS